MKIFKMLFLLIFSSLFSLSQSSTPKLFKLNSVNFSLGQVYEFYQKMDMNSMRDISTSPAIFSHDLDGYTENLWRESYGFIAQLDANFSLYNAMTESFALNREVRVGLSFSEREPAINYNKREIRNNGAEEYTEDIIYCNMQSEINVTGAFIWKTGGNKKRIIRGYVGLGGNIGSAINNKMIVMRNSNLVTTDPVTEERNYEHTEMEYTEIKARSAIFVRAAAPVGFELNLWRIQLGLEGNVGMGLHQSLGGKSHFMPFTFNYLMRAGFKF